MARVQDRQIDFMRAHSRLFDLLPEDPERSFGYPNCKEGWRDIWRGSVPGSKTRSPRARPSNSFASSRSSACSGSTGTVRCRTAPEPRSLRQSILPSRARPAPAKPVAPEVGCISTAPGWRPLAPSTPWAIGCPPNSASRTSESCAECLALGKSTTRWMTARPTRGPRYRPGAGNGAIATARFRCGACGQEGEFVYDPACHECPRCGSSDVVFALPIHELPDEFTEALASAEPLDDDQTDED